MVQKSNSSELSKEVWRIKDKGGELSIKWRIIKHHAAYNPVAKRCNLCLSEKLSILEYEGRNILNKRDELMSKCRHRNKYTLLILVYIMHFCPGTMTNQAESINSDLQGVSEKSGPVKKYNLIDFKKSLNIQPMFFK